MRAPPTITQYWSGRAYTFPEGTSAWISRYWDSWQAPYRQRLADALAPFVGAGARSVLEIGCHCGPNLRLWRSRWPTLQCWGFDVSTEAIAAGQQFFAGDPHADVWVEDLRRALTLPRADVVVSCYALAYVPPEELAETVGRLRDAARMAMILAEPMAFGGDAEGRCADDPEEYRHDYVRLLAWHGVATVTMLEPVDRLNAILTFTPQPEGTRP